MVSDYFLRRGGFLMTLSVRILNNEHFSKEAWMHIFEDEHIDTLDLLHEAYNIRKHYYGKRVKLNMILNAKSGICPEDCGYCGQSREMKQKQRYSLVDKEQIKDGANVAREHQIGTYCIVTVSYTHL